MKPIKATPDKVTLLMSRRPGICQAVVIHCGKFYEYGPIYTNYEEQKAYSLLRAVASHYELAIDAKRQLSKLEDLTHNVSWFDIQGNSLDTKKVLDLRAKKDMQEHQQLRDDPLASEIEAYPAYWRILPPHYKALDFYRVRALFPLPEGFESARLDHALKKLLIPGNRTGGKSVYKDLKEAHATLGQWLREHKDALDQ